MSVSRYHDRSQLFTTHLERLSAHTKVLNLILVCRGSKTTADNDINVLHKRVNRFSSLNITDFLPNDAQIATKDVLKLGATRRPCGQMESIIVSRIKELIDNAEKEFLV